jgi:DNA-binding IclR family transcriptional regulator
MDRLLRVMGDQPHLRWTLADLSRKTGISKASAHSVLLALVDIGFVRRHERPVAYSLGPTLAELGQRARASRDIRELADHELAELSNVTGCSTMVGAVRGEEIVVVSALSVPHPFGMSVQPGARLSFAAPVGMLYAAWSSESEIERWVERASPPLPARRREALRQELETVRNRGWSATVRSDPKTHPHVREVHEVRDQDFDASDIDVIGVSAPVWKADGGLECSIAIVDLPPRLDGPRVRAFGAKVATAAQRLTHVLETTDGRQTPDL